jgi:phosphate transport system substrate-binding protein
MTAHAVLAPLALLALCGLGGSCTSSRTDEKPPPVVVHLNGAGATFPAPLYEYWLAEYHKLHPEVHLRYDAVGSGVGILRFLAEAVDFGASDAAMTDGDMALVPRGVQLIPVVAGSIVLAYHLPGVAGELRRPRDVYTDIFLGKITQWDDPRLQATNPDSYPIVTYSWLLLYQRYDDPQKAVARKAFVRWCLKDG